MRRVFKIQGVSAYVVAENKEVAESITGRTCNPTKVLVEVEKNLIVDNLEDFNEVII